MIPVVMHVFLTDRKRPFHPEGLFLCKFTGLI